MYILVEKDLATEKEKEKKYITWKTYGLVSIRLLYLNECTSNLSIILQRRKMLERLIRTAAQSMAAQTRKKNRIRNPRVYIYRATSVMLTSLCVSFPSRHQLAAARFFPTKHSLRCWSSVSRLSTRRRSCWMSCCCCCCCC